MKSVYDKLKQDIKDQIDKDLVQHQFSRVTLVTELKEKTNYMSVSYEGFFTLQQIATQIGYDRSDRTHFIDFLTE